MAAERPGWQPAQQLPPLTISGVMQFAPSDLLQTFNLQRLAIRESI
jgi:hypothetical protein